jgi:hypothetical protein
MAADSEFSIDDSPRTAADKPLAPGLYLVATPIGNLEDITLRALRILRSVDRIACEDTRQTQKLLNHFGIKVPTVSYHMHNELARTEELTAELKAGGRIAIVSDAVLPESPIPEARSPRLRSLQESLCSPFQEQTPRSVASSRAGCPPNRSPFTVFFQRRKASGRLRLRLCSAMALPTSFTRLPTGSKTPSLISKRSSAPRSM